MFKLNQMSYYVEDASKYGTLAATLLLNLRNWVKNKAIYRQDFHEGHIWVYYSINDMAQLFPQFTYKQVEKGIAKLIREGALLTGNYNKLKFDRTRWFALTDQEDYLEAWEIKIPEETSPKNNDGNSPFTQKRSHNLTKGEMTFTQKAATIPSINTIKNKEINTYVNSNELTDDVKNLACKEEETKKEETTKLNPEDVVTLYNKIVEEKGGILPKALKLTDSRAKAIKRLTKELFPTFQEWEVYFQGIHEADFLTGKETSFRANIDFILRFDKAVKAVEGGYINKNNKNKFCRR